MSTDFSFGEAQYDELVGRLVSGGAMQEASFLWWEIRPSLRYATLELRIADACTNPEDAVAIAALYCSLIACLECHPEHGNDGMPITCRIVDENRWRAQR